MFPSSDCENTTTNENNTTPSPQTTLVVVPNPSYILDDYYKHTQASYQIMAKVIDSNDDFKGQ